MYRNRRTLVLAHFIVLASACSTGAGTEPDPDHGGTTDPGTETPVDDNDDDDDDGDDTDGTGTPADPDDPLPGDDDGSDDPDPVDPDPTTPDPDAPDGSNCMEEAAGGLAFPYIYYDRDKVLLDGIDFEATLKIAELELAHGGASTVLTIWTIRDQIMPASVAAKINELYLQYIDGEGLAVQEGIFGHDFAVWHFAWAMGNIYRLGPADVRHVMRDAYEDALTRPGTINAPYDGILESHLTGDCVFMGDAHDGGRSYARSHIVIPGNPDYLQSFEDYTPP